ncbi:hypothetical protein [Sorangium sp. So ce1024]|uniref:hypothetical protein n=1 Tax=unclassified Sorangium TaxID=2621164 RepID=UPI003F0A09E9
MEIGVIDLDGPGTKHSRNIAVVCLDSADGPPCRRERRKEQREEQRDPGEK